MQDFWCSSFFNIIIEGRRHDYSYFTDERTEPKCPQATEAVKWYRQHLNVWNLTLNKNHQLSACKDLCCVICIYVEKRNHVFGTPIRKREEGDLGEVWSLHISTCRKEKNTESPGWEGQWSRLYKLTGIWITSQACCGSRLLMLECENKIQTHRANTLHSDLEADCNRERTVGLNVYFYLNKPSCQEMLGQVSAIALALIVVWTLDLMEYEAVLLGGHINPHKNLAWWNYDQPALWKRLPQAPSATNGQD